MTYIYSLTSNRLISLTRVLVSTSVIKYCSVAHTNMCFHAIRNAR